MAASSNNNWKTEFIYRLKYVKLVRLLCLPFLELSRRRRVKRFSRTADSSLIRSFKGAGEGKRCFIIGNGPSLLSTDLDKIKDVSFGANSIYKLFGKTEWRPTYYMCIDREFIGTHKDDFSCLDAPYVFMDYAEAGHIERSEHIHYFCQYARATLKKNTCSAILFSEDPSKYFGCGYTVTYASLQMAIYMGFSEIYLLGMDHTYSKTIDEQGNISIDERIQSHFSEQKPSLFDIQFRDGVDYAYRLAREEAEKRGIRIYNATRGGKLEIFERVDFDSIIAPQSENGR